MRYDKEIVKKICELLESDSYTVAEICKIVNIAEATFYDWKSKKAEFSEAIKVAQRKFDVLCVVEAKKSLLKKIKGYSVDETKTVMVEGKPGKDGEPAKPKIKEQTKITKHFQPDTASIIFLLTNKASDEFKNRQNTDVTTKGDKLPAPQPQLVFLSADDMSQDQIDKLIEQNKGVNSDDIGT